MLRYLVGPLLLCAGYAAGSYFGADSEQLVLKSPSITYAGFEQAIGDMPAKGASLFEDSAPIGYQVRIDRNPDQKLVLSLWLGGQMGAQADIDFLPRDGGSKTLVVAKIHSDHNVLRAALAGSRQSRLAYAPDWMLNLTFRPVLRQLSEQVESRAVSDYKMQAQSGSTYPAEQANQIYEWRPYDATRPTIDPEADAQHYLEGRDTPAK